MGLFDMLLGPSKKQKEANRPPRGKAKPATEKLAREEALYLSHLRNTNPSKWMAIMEQRMGISLQGQDSLEQFEEMVKRFKAIGLIKSPKDLAEGEDSLKEMITAALPVVAAIVQAQGQAAAMRAAAQNPHPMVSVATPAVVAPAQSELPAEASGAAAPQQEGPAVEMSFRARMVKTSLERMGPQQAAEWLVGLKHEQIDQLVGLVCECPDDKLPALLTGLGQKAPEFAGLTWWLAGRGQWLVDTAAALRQLRGQTATQAGGEPPASAYGL